MMRPRLIKNEDDYEAALARIDALMDSGPQNKDETDELELLAVLIERYEETAFPIDLPSPIDAIRFRMEQEGLRQEDLVPYIGSKSKVSEVLSGKRTLSLQMIRKLHSGLGIPAEVLVKEPGAVLTDDAGVDWLKFPIAEMRKRGWFENFNGSLGEAKQYAEELISAFAGEQGPELLEPVFLRSGATKTREMDGYALAAWRIEVCRKAGIESLPSYRPGSVTKKLAKNLIKLSLLDNGPSLAKEYLNRYGIHLVAVRHLSKTYLDGATMINRRGNPVIALTLRYDRLDNFWFTLSHELAHVALHLEKKSCLETFFDDLDNPSDEATEKEADKWASSVLLEPAKWAKSGLDESSPAADVAAWAEREGITPAIPAGRIRKESGRYNLYSRLVGTNRVRRLFPGSGW